MNRSLRTLALAALCLIPALAPVQAQTTAVFARPWDSFSTTVTSPYSTGAGVISVASTANLPALTGSRYFRLTATRGTSPETKLTHFKATGFTSTTFTGVVAWDTAAGYVDTALQVGDIISIRPTAETMEDIHAAIGGLGTAANLSTSAVAQAANNLSDLASSTVALTNLLPSQTGNSGKVLGSNGTTAAWVAQTGGGSSGLTLTRVAASANHTMAANELCDGDATSASFTMTLPTAPADGTIAVAKMTATASGHTVTVACGGSDVINKVGGSTTLTLSTVNSGSFLLYKSSPAIWFVLSVDPGATATQSANTVYAGPGTGSAATPAFRSLVGADLPALTGDVTSSGAATTLATVNGNVGSFTSANITVDAKGRITAAANGSGGGLTIGNAVTGGAVKAILTEDASSNLLASANFTWDPVAQTQTVTSTSTGLAASFTNGTNGLTIRPQNGGGYTAISGTSNLSIAQGANAALQIGDINAFNQIAMQRSQITSGTANLMYFLATPTQTGTAGYTGFNHNVVESSGTTGSGTKYLAGYQLNTTTLYAIDRFGRPVYLGSAPTVAVGAGAGTGGSPTVTVAGSEAECVVTLSTGTSAGTTNGVAFTLTYANAWAAAPKTVWIQPANAAAAALTSGQQLFIDDSTTTTTTVAPITGGTALPTGAVLKFKVISFG